MFISPWRLRRMPITFEISNTTNSCSHMANFRFCIALTSLLLVFTNTIVYIECAKTKERDVHSTDLLPSGLETDIDDPFDTTMHEQSELLRLKAACVEGRYGCRRKRFLLHRKQNGNNHPFDLRRQNRENFNDISLKKSKQHIREIFKMKREIMDEGLVRELLTLDLDNGGPLGETDEIDHGSASKSSSLDSEFNKFLSGLTAPTRTPHGKVNTPSRNIDKPATNESSLTVDRPADVHETEVNGSAYDNSTLQMSGMSTDETTMNTTRKLDSDLIGNTTASETVSMDQKNVYLATNPYTNENNSGLPGSYGNGPYEDNDGTSEININGSLGNNSDPWDENSNNPPANNSKGSPVINSNIPSVNNSNGSSDNDTYGPSGNNSNSSPGNNINGPLKNNIRNGTSERTIDVTESNSDDPSVNIPSENSNITNTSSITGGSYSVNDSLDVILKKIESTIEDKISKEDLLDHWLTKNQEFEKAFETTDDDPESPFYPDDISRRNIQEANKSEDSSITYGKIDNDPNSGFSPWGKWGPCSATCGVGRSERKRTCKERSHCQSGDIEIKMCRSANC